MEISTTAWGVEAKTPRHINERIRRTTECSVVHHALQPELIGGRLEELNEEWPIERVLQAQAAGVVLTGVVMSVVRGRKWLGLSVFSGYFLLQHALQGWCPPVSVFRRMGVRTSREIAVERAALKAVRGDFGEVSRERDPLARALAALRAAEGGRASGRIASRPGDDDRAGINRQRDMEPGGARGVHPGRDGDEHAGRVGPSAAKFAGGV